MKDVVEWLRGHFGIVRARQLADRLRHRLSFIPGVYVVVSIVVVQLTLWFDRTVATGDIPRLLSTTVDSARSVFSVIAGGLITSITLLLSMMLVAVQLASSQFSPRTLRDWLGDVVLKHTLGIVLATTVFSLLALRSTRAFGDAGGQNVPHSSVIVAVVFAVVSLFAVVRSVDHITHSLQIGAVAQRIARDTIAVIENDDDLRAGQDPTQVPSTGVEAGVEEGGDIPSDAFPIEATRSGWVQQVGASTILDHLPEGSTGHVVVPLGAFVTTNSPLMWVSSSSELDEEHTELLHNAFALGDTRTLQEDVAYGILQLTDIAVRALSPGVNDPSTANDVIVHLGDLMLALWAKPAGDAVTTHNGRTLVRREPHHEEHLSRAFDPVRRYGRTDPAVLTTLVRTLRTVRVETQRRSLVGPLEPLDEMIRSIHDTADTSGWADHEVRELDDLCSVSRPE